MNGRSPTTWALFTPRMTARVWPSISSIVTGTVSRYPSSTMPRLSPTRMMSIPASSTHCACGNEYAVIMEIFFLSFFIPCRSGIMIFLMSLMLSCSSE